MRIAAPEGAAGTSTGGEVANALVCKTSIRGFNSRPVLQSIGKLNRDDRGGRAPYPLVSPLIAAAPAGSRLAEPDIAAASSETFGLIRAARPLLTVPDDPAA